MKFTKIRPKTEIEEIKEACKAQGFDYDKTQLRAESDTKGNIISIETNDEKLQAILKERGFDT